MTAKETTLIKDMKEIMADIPNFTRIAPVMQISEVVVGP